MDNIGTKTLERLNIASILSCDSLTSNSFSAFSASCLFYLAFLGWTFIFILYCLVCQEYSGVFPPFSFLVFSVVLISSLPPDFMLSVLGWSTWSLSLPPRPPGLPRSNFIQAFRSPYIPNHAELWSLRSSKRLLSLISSVWSPSIATASRSAPSGGRRQKTQPDVGRDDGPTW